jgi:hypothetical protein
LISKVFSFLLLSRLNYTIIPVLETFMSVRTYKYAQTISYNSSYSKLLTMCLHTKNHFRRTFKTKKCEKILVNHFYHGINNKCGSFKCWKIKLLNSHFKTCIDKKSCSWCNQFLALISIHSKNCDKIKNCLVPYCDQFKLLNKTFKVSLLLQN